MKFLDALRAPQYTLATRPAAATAAGRLVYITDAAVGQKLQLSDAVAWGSAGGTDLTTLSATVPDKIIWGGVVELYGESIDLANTVFANYAQDNFATDDFNANFSLMSGSTARGGSVLVWTNSGFGTGLGYMKSSGGNTDWALFNTLPRTADAEVRVRYQNNGNDNTPNGGVIIASTATDALYVGFTQNFINNFSLTLYTKNAGTLQGGTGSTMVTWDGWLVARKVGNVVTGEFWQGADLATATLQGSVTATLAGANATNFGAGVISKVGMKDASTSSGGALQGWKWGQFTLRDKGTVNHRRLMAAITPSGAARQAFPLADIDPTGAIVRPTYLQEVNALGLSDAAVDALLSYAAANGQMVSDPAEKSLIVRQGGAWTRLAPMASPAFTGTIGLPQYTLATRPAATVGAGKAIYVTDADLGSRFQVSDGATWRNYNPSQLTGTNTQTASYTLALTDAGGVVEENSASATTVTVPPNSAVAFPIGTLVEVNRYGAGTVAIAAGVGVTIRSQGALLNIANQYSSVFLRKRATDEWVLSGDRS
jgi:3D (Asp-Asp-Asp) domain-containing protein